MCHLKAVAPPPVLAPPLPKAIIIGSGVGAPRPIPSIGPVADMFLTVKERKARQLLQAQSQKEVIILDESSSVQCSEARKGLRAHLEQSNQWSSEVRNDWKDRSVDSLKLVDRLVGNQLPNTSDFAAHAVLASFPTRQMQVTCCWPFVSNMFMLCMMWILF